MEHFLPDYNALYQRLDILHDLQDRLAEDINARKTFCYRLYIGIKNIIFGRTRPLATQLLTSLGHDARAFSTLQDTTATTGDAILREIAATDKTLSKTIAKTTTMYAYLHDELQDLETIISDETEKLHETPSSTAAYLIQEDTVRDYARARSDGKNRSAVLASTIKDLHCQRTTLDQQETVLRHVVYTARTLNEKADALEACIPATSFFYAALLKQHKCFPVLYTALGRQANLITQMRSILERSQDAMFDFTVGRYTPSASDDFLSMLNVESETAWDNDYAQTPLQ